MDTSTAAWASFALVGLLVLFSAAAIAWFSRLMGRAVSLTEEEKVKRWDLFLKGFGSFLVVVGGLVGFLRYLHQRADELAQQATEEAQSTREANVRIYGQSATFDAAQRILLNEVADLAATLATSERADQPEFRLARARFERLYHGQLVLYENQYGSVVAAMIDFRDALLKWERGGQKPEFLSSDERSNPRKGELREEMKNSDFMRRLALSLSNACRDELDELNKRTPSTE